MSIRTKQFLRAKHLPDWAFPFPPHVPTTQIFRSDNTTPIPLILGSTMLSCNNKVISFIYPLVWVESYHGHFKCMPRYHDSHESYDCPSITNTSNNTIPVSRQRYHRIGCRRSGRVRLSCLTADRTLSDPFGESRDRVKWWKSSYVDMIWILIQSLIESEGQWTSMYQEYPYDPFGCDMWKNRKPILLW